MGGLCTATVYRLCARGELAHVRVSNARCSWVRRVDTGDSGEAVPEGASEKVEGVGVPRGEEERRERSVTGHLRQHAHEHLAGERVAQLVEGLPQAPQVGVLLVEGGGRVGDGKHRAGSVGY